MSAQRTSHARRARNIAAAIVLAVSTLTAAPASSLAVSLSSPAGGESAEAYESVTFRWTGALEGDTAPVDTRTTSSFFRVEIAPTADVPGGVDSAWPSLANYTITDPGVTATSAQMGVSSEGSYSWRVCAWGIADTAVSNEVELLSCTNARSLTITAASSGGFDDGGDVTITETTTVPGEVTTDLVTTGSTTTTPAASTTSSEPQDNVTTDLGEDADGSLVGSGDGSASESDSGLFDGVTNFGSKIGGALSGDLFDTGIPYWVLVLFGIVVPVVLWFRRSTVSMFDIAEVNDVPLGDLDESPLKGAGAPADDAARQPFSRTRESGDSAA